MVRKDAWGFTYGILCVLLGIANAYVGLIKDSLFFVFMGSLWVLLGLINDVYIITYWLGRERERKIARAFRSKQKIYPTIICPSCGKKISADYSQCPWCGTLLAYNEYQAR